MVTVCSELQLEVLKVSDAGDTVPSLASLVDNPMVTLAVGCVFNFTVKVAVPPTASVV